MKVEEIKLALEKNKETHLQFALVDDIKKIYSNANKMYENNTSTLKKYAQQLEKDFQNTANEYKKALNKYNELEKSSKDLGIEVPNDIKSIKGLIEYGIKDSLKSKSNAVDILAI